MKQFNIVSTYTQSMPCKLDDEGNFDFIRVQTVLTQDGCGMYAAYIAASIDSQFVARHGNKLSRERAAIYFPEITENNYRR